MFKRRLNPKLKVAGKVRLQLVQLCPPPAHVPVRRREQLGAALVAHMLGLFKYLQICEFNVDFK